MSCTLTRTRPRDTDLVGGSVAEAFMAGEAAKRRLVFQLLELGLPGVSPYGPVEDGPRFDLLTEVGYDAAPWPRRAPIGWPWSDRVGEAAGWGGRHQVAHRRPPRQTARLQRACTVPPVS